MEILTIDKLKDDRIWRLPAACGMNVTWLSMHAHGRNHYQLIHRLCSMWPDESFFEAGAGMASGSVAALLGMSEGSGHVFTCDVQAHAFARAGWQVQIFVKDYQQRWHLNFGEHGDMSHRSRVEEALRCKVILLDGPHTGDVEERFVSQIIDNDWRGVMIIDDSLNKALKKTCDMSQQAARASWDLTEYCHESGTLLVDFGDNVEFRKNEDARIRTKR